MAIYDYDNSRAERLGSFSYLTSTSRSKGSVSNSRLTHLIEKGEYEKALDLLRSCDLQDDLLNTKAVLLMRTGKAEAAVSLLRPVVWDSKTFLLKPDAPIHMKLNFATALLLTGHVAGCIDIIRTVNEPDNEQVKDLWTEIRAWEKSLSVFCWLDWKACGIEHIKGEFPVSHFMGRFGWEPKALAVRDESANANNSGLANQNLAC